MGVRDVEGELANWHPHVHALVSRGGWTRDWEWVPVAHVDEHAAEQLYRHKVMRMLRDEGLLSEERTKLLPSWRHTGLRRRFAACDPPWPAGGRRPPFPLSGPACAGPATPSATATSRCPAACVSVHNGVRVEPEDQAAVERLARYIMRPPISLDRMEWGGEGVVLYRAKGGHDGRTLPAGDPSEAFDPADFLARVIMHIPEPRRHLVRYYGAYSNVSRGKRRRQAEAATVVAPRDVEYAASTRADQDHSPDARALRRSWARLIKRVYEVDPLVCPSCGGEMRIIAFIIEHDVVDAILRHLAKTEALSPRGPPGAAALLPAASCTRFGSGRLWGVCLRRRRLVVGPKFGARCAATGSPERRF